MTPLVTICVPTRNRVASLRKSLESILGQDYPAIEVIISDNASTDGTDAFCRELAAPDTRIRYIRHDRNIGLHGNHNFCLGAGTGEFLCVFHDHDDRDLSLVSTYVAFLQAHPDVGLVCSDWELIDDAGRRLGPRDHDVDSVTPGLQFIERTIRSGRSAVGIPGTMIRRAALGSIRFIDAAPVGFGDFPVWFEVAERWNIGHVSERLWRWTQSAQSESARTITSMSRDYYQNLSSYCDAHLRRWPDHGALVARWRSDITRYLFWALAYETGLYFRTMHAGPSGLRADAHDGSRTLFEILGYRLEPEQFQEVLTQMRAWRTGPLQHAAFCMINALVRVNCTWPLAWGIRHHALVRNVLGLR
jgi:glycosyltransferase involved in cell wall biosynthesis